MAECGDNDQVAEQISDPYRQSIYVSYRDASSEEIIYERCPTFKTMDKDKKETRSNRNKNKKQVLSRSERHQRKMPSDKSSLFTSSQDTTNEEEYRKELLAEMDSMSDEVFGEVITTPTPSDKTETNEPLICPFNMTVEDNTRFGRLEIFHRPVKLIYSDENSNSLKISERVLEQISSIDVTLNVVAICGLYRTGKSYLLNRLAGERTGFSLGDTVRSETKGIWAWCKPHPTQKDQVLLLLDTEGLGDIDKGDADHDNKMFSLTMLLCSTMIYNNSGVFNLDALEKLAFITQLTKKVQVMPLKGEKNNDNDISVITPVFILCLRDFYLRLKDPLGKEISADEYFEDCLSNSSDGNKGEVINQTRCCIRKYFPRRKCFTLTQPAVGRTLSRIEEMDDAKLDDDFISEVEELKEYVYKCEEKVMDGVTRTPVRGSEFVSLTRTYVAALQNDSVMTYEKAYEQVSKFHNSKLVVDYVCEFKATMNNINRPVKRKKELGETILHEMVEKLKQLRENMYPYRVTVFEEKAKTKMKILADVFQYENGILVQNVLLATLEAMHSEIIKDKEYLFDRKDGSELYREEIDLLKALFQSKMHEYDEDELIKAMANFKLRIKDEKMRIIYKAKMIEEKERNEKIQYEMERTMSTFFDSKFKEIEAEQTKKMVKDLRTYKRNLNERYGEEAVKKMSFFKRFKLLFT